MPVSTTSGISGAAIRARRIAVNPCASGKPRSRRIMSTVHAARYRSASDMKLTHAKSTSGDPSLLNISRSKRASPGLSSTSRTFLIVRMLIRFVSTTSGGLLVDDRDAWPGIQLPNPPGIRNNAARWDILQFRNAGSQQFGKSPRRDRPAEVEPLGLVALVGAEKFEFFKGFHAPGDHPQLETASHADPSGYNDGVVTCGTDLANERLIDLEGIDRKFSEIAEARVARAEVVDRDLHSAVSQSFKDRR